MNDWLPWIPLAAATMHIIEEFVWPGGFRAWYRDYRPEIASSLSTTFLVFINALLLALCALIVRLGLTPRGAALFLTITAVLLGNAVFHLRATIRMRRYSPGVVTGVALYIPLAICGYVVVLNAGLASIPTAIVSAVMGGSYQLLSMANHRRRARGAPRRRTSPASDSAAVRRL